MEWGYFPNPEVKKKIQELRTPSILANLIFVLADYFLIFCVPALLFAFMGSLVLISFPLTMILSARGMRGFECLVHDGSHYNIIDVREDGVPAAITRSLGIQPRLRPFSDLIVNSLVALPMFSSVGNYRASHERHHKLFATENDPDFVRHKELGLSELNRTKPLQFSYALMRKFVPYWRSWWRAIGTDKDTALKGTVWHIALVALISTFVGISNAISFWVFAFLLPFSFVLPVLRFIGEAAEHDYAHNNTIAEKTFSNTGLAHRAIFHPHNDGYHTLHHVIDYVPHHNLVKLEQFIRDHDWEPYHNSLRNRTRVFEEA